MSLKELSSDSYDKIVKAREEFQEVFQATVISDTVKDIISNSVPIGYNSETGESPEITDENHAIELNDMIGRSAKDLTNDAIKGKIIKTGFGENEIASNFLDSISQAAESLIEREALQRQNWFIEQIRHGRIPQSEENYVLFTKRLTDLFKNKSFSMEGLETLYKSQMELAKSFEEENIIENIKERVENDIEEAEIRQNEIVTVMQEVSDTSHEYEEEIIEKANEDDIETEPVEVDETEDNELKIPDDGVEDALENVNNDDNGSSNEAIQEIKQKKSKADKLAKKIKQARELREGKASNEDFNMNVNTNADVDDDKFYDMLIAQTKDPKEKARLQEEKEIKRIRKISEKRREEDEALRQAYLERLAKETEDLTKIKAYLEKKKAIKYGNIANDKNIKEVKKLFGFFNRLFNGDLTSLDAYLKMIGKIEYQSKSGPININGWNEIITQTKYYRSMYKTLKKVIIIDSSHNPDYITVLDITGKVFYFIPQTQAFTPVSGDFLDYLKLEISKADKLKSFESLKQKIRKSLENLNPNPSELSGEEIEAQQTTTYVTDEEYMEVLDEKSIFTKGSNPDNGPEPEKTENIAKVDNVDDVFNEYVSDPDPASQEDINNSESDKDLDQSFGNKAKSVGKKGNYKTSKSKEEGEAENIDNEGAAPEGVGAMATYQNVDNFGSDSAQIDVPDGLDIESQKEISENSDNIKFEFGPGDDKVHDGEKAINPLRGTGGENEQVAEDNTNIATGNSNSAYSTSEEVLKRLVPLSEIKFTQDPIYSVNSISNYLYRIGEFREDFIGKVEKRLNSLESIVSNSRLNLVPKFNKLKENWEEGKKQSFMYDISISKMGLTSTNILSKEDLFTLAVTKNILNRYHMKGSGYKFKRITRDKDVYNKSIERLVDHIFTYYYFAHRLDKAKDITYAKEGLALHEEKINGAIYDLTPEDKERCINLKNLLVDGQLNKLFVTDSLLLDFNNIFSRVKDTKENATNILTDMAFKDKVLDNLEKKNLNITESIESILDTIIFKKSDPTSIDPPIFTSILMNLSKKHVLKSSESIANKSNRSKLYTEAKVFLTIKRSAEALGINSSEFEQEFANEFLSPMDMTQLANNIE